MTAFPLRIVTPDGIRFDGTAERVILRTSTGDAAIMARHADYVASLGMGQAVVETGKQRRLGACIGGMVCVMHGAVTLVPTTFEWAEEIDAERAERVRNDARKELSREDLSDMERRQAKARLKRALVRLGVVVRKEE